MLALKVQSHRMRPLLTGGGQRRTGNARFHHYYVLVDDPRFPDAEAVEAAIRSGGGVPAERVMIARPQVVDDGPPAMVVLPGREPVVLTSADVRLLRPFDKRVVILED